MPSQPHRRAEVPILTHNDGSIILPLVCEPNQVNRQTNINALFLPVLIDSPRVDLNSTATQISEFIGPEPVPEGVYAGIRNPCVKTHLSKSTSRNTRNEGLSYFLHIVAWVCVGRTSYRCPSVLGQTVEVLAIDEYNGAHRHTKNTRPGSKAKSQVQRAGRKGGKGDGAAHAPGPGPGGRHGGERPGYPASGIR